MLHPEVQFRAKLSDIISYPWFTREVDISKYDYEKVLSGNAMNVPMKSVSYLENSFYSMTTLF